MTLKPIQLLLLMALVTAGAQAAGRSTIQELQARADAGDAEAQWLLASAYGTGNGIPIDKARAAELERKSAEQGFAPAETALGMIYARGEGVAKDPILAHAWLSLANAQGDERARAQLQALESSMTPQQKIESLKIALDRATGNSGRLDESPAVKKQVRPKYPDDLHRLGHIGGVLVGFVVDMNGDVQNVHVVRSTESGFESAAIEAVAQWKFAPARKNGHPVNASMYVPVYFSLLLENARPEDVQEQQEEIANALRNPGPGWAAFLMTLNKACAEDIDAQYFVGLSYARGVPMQKDASRAVKWYRRSAEKDSASSQNNLGSLYSRGDGVPKDLGQARYWWNRAAAQGNITARKNLAILKEISVPDHDAK
jgi:TonB family protein